MEKLIGATLEEQREYEQHQKEIIKHIEKHERYLMENNILAGASSFKSKVESFYGFFTYESPMPPFDTKIGITWKPDNNPSAKNKGKCPEDLIEIISNFNKESFDASKLYYDSVREDYQIRNSFSRKATRIILFAIAFVVLIGSIVISIDITPGLTTRLIAGIGMMVALTVLFWLNSSCSRPRKTNGSLAEYKRLYENAWRADWFMDNTYREYFIEKCYHKN
ncbi:MAG: hypothetical protein U9M90_02310 [Patescibacteria group bacterium]|nr:hypothetical protein [Patescibacteria group bacterium]